MMHQQTPEQKRATQNEIDDLVATMSERSGRAFVWGLLERCQTFATPYTPDSDQSAFNAGGQNFGLYYFGMINKHCPELYAKMVQEHNAKQRVKNGR